MSAAVRTLKRYAGIALAVAALFIPQLAAAESDIRVFSGAPAATYPWPLSARLAGPTDRYPHNVLGPIPGFGELVVEIRLCRDCPDPQRIARIRLPESRVFEDVAPRLWDVTSDGRPEIVVVESDARRGARLSVWSLDPAEQKAAALMHPLASTDFIGTRFRWLAPVGIADFTGDGLREIAYVETPHLGRTLRLVRRQGNRLVEIAAHRGVTNHRIGDPFIVGGVRDCDSGPEIILASADWRRAIALRYAEGGFAQSDLGALTEPTGLSAHLNCPG